MAGVMVGRRRMRSYHRMESSAPHPYLPPPQINAGSIAGKMAIAASALTFAYAHPFLSLIYLSLAAVVSVVLYVFGPSRNTNPFREDSVRPPSPLVREQASRDRVLKQGFTSKKVPANLDAIVVGSGIGGLATAAILARSGKRVLVLEQHDQAGGCCHTYIEKGYEFDVGIHYIGEMAPGSDLRVFMDQITDGQLEWEKMGPEFDRTSIGRNDYHIMQNYKHFQEELIRQFPEERAAIEKYAMYLEDIKVNAWPFGVIKMVPRWLASFLIKIRFFHTFSSLFGYSSRDLNEVVQELTDNKELQAVFSYNFGDHGMLPQETCFALQAMVLSHFVISGSYYPRGGCSEIAFHIIPTIEKSGGAVLVRAPVKEIIIENGSAVGVRVKKGGELINIMAPQVISDAGVFNTFEKLLPLETAKNSSYLADIKPLMKRHGVAFQSLFVGLNGSSEDLKLKQFNHWIFDAANQDELAEQYLAKSAEEASQTKVPMLFVSFPSAKDPSWESRMPGKSVCIVLTITNYGWFEEWEKTRIGHRGQEYVDFKTALGKQMWAQVVSHYPDLEDKVDYFEVGSPLSNNHYIASPKGEVYGLDHSKERFSAEGMIALRPDTDIPGLIITGQDLITGGFAGALLGGIVASCAALNRQVFVDLLRFKLRMWWNNNNWPWQVKVKKLH